MVYSTKHILRFHRITLYEIWKTDKNKAELNTQLNKHENIKT
jgi:hypothetical protein